MSPERWRKLKDICGAVLECAPVQRGALLAELCSGDDELKGQVEELLEEKTSSGSILNGGPLWEKWGIAAEVPRSTDDEMVTAPRLDLPSIDREFPLGTILANRYRIVALLGRGGMGEVYRADDLTLGEAVALKFLPKAFASDPVYRERFFAEVRITRQLSHPNICRVYDIGEFESHHFLSMEYIDGEDLSSLIARVGYLPTEKALDVTRQFVAGLAAAHERGIVHRDLKPANIMLDGHGRLRITDFGIAIGAGDESQVGQIAGTPAYMAPEQLTGQRATVRSDIYSLGLVLYEIFCGRKAYAASTITELCQEKRRPPIAPSEIRAGVDPVLERLILQCLEYDPEQRPASAVHLAATLSERKQSGGTRDRASANESKDLRPTIRNNLPRLLTRFIGRHRELVELQSILAANRLVTLTGSGGVGKTRLALQLALNLLNAYSDGVWFVDLAPLSDATSVPQTVLSVIGIHEAPGRSVMQTLTDYLANRNVLLIFDNCEHLVQTCAQLADAVLRVSTNLHIVATSREALKVPGENLFRVPSLALPDSERASTVDHLNEYEAIQLFVDRAHLVQTTFALNAQNAQAVAEICIRLDGIPLAIELAASRVNVLTVDQIHARLVDQLTLLTGGSRTVPARQQTLRAAIDWSYNLLTAAEQMLFRRLSVFSGGWTLEGVEAICTGNGLNQQQVFELLSELVDKSLVSAEDVPGEKRYQLLESLQQFARQRLHEADEVHMIEQRHTHFFVPLVQEGENKLRGPEQWTWSVRLTDEYDNIRAVLNRALTDNSGTALILAGALSEFWDITGRWAEARTWLKKALELPGLPAAKRAKALNAAGEIARRQGEYRSAQALSQEALRMSRTLNDEREAARSLFNLGFTALREAQYEAARGLFQQSLVVSRGIADEHGILRSLNGLAGIATHQSDHVTARSLLEDVLLISRRLGDKRRIANTLNNLGMVARETGDYSLALSRLEEGLEISYELGDRRGIAALLSNMGTVMEDQGEYGAARQLYEQSMALSRELGDKDNLGRLLIDLGSICKRQGDYVASHLFHMEAFGVVHETGNRRLLGYLLLNLGELAQVKGDYATARARYQESLEIRRVSGETSNIANTLDKLGCLSVEEGDSQRGVRLLAAADVIRKQVSAPRAPVDCDQYDRYLNAVQVNLGKEAFSAGWSEGQRMTLDQIIAYAFETDQLQDS